LQQEAPSTLPWIRPPYHRGLFILYSLNAFGYQGHNDVVPNNLYVLPYSERMGWECYICTDKQRPTLPCNRRSHGDYIVQQVPWWFAATLVMTCARMVFRTCLVSSVAEKATAHEPRPTAGHDAKQLEPGDRKEQLFFVDPDGELTAMQKGRAVTPLRSAGDARIRPGTG
jgi:hypothetical protein